jgi:filamentous hemagglutinin
LNGFQSELRLANDIADLDGQTVVKYGDRVGTRGADIVSVGNDGTVSLWDSKFRSADVNIKSSPTFTDASRLNNAMNDARIAVSNAPNLSAGVRAQALQNIARGNARALTIQAGQVRNSVVTFIVKNKPL